VTVAATVRDRRGRRITNLTAADFTLLDTGAPRKILEFSTEEASVGLALLVDVSGSMGVADRRNALQETAKALVQWLTKEDQVGLYAFDRGLEEVQPIGTSPDRVLDGLKGIDAYGRTSVFDAVAETSRRLSKTAGPRRAVILLTDGDDNASTLTSAQVSAIARGIDVPVYVFLIISPLDRAGGNDTVIDDKLDGMRNGALGNLARRTGGDILIPVTPEERGVMTRDVVTELRHQYLMAFEPGGQTGWHPLEVRTRRTDLIVRARSGYMVPGRPGDRH
jgi:Ca-activated chloride channel family protein